jgi:hypothetical protein
VCGEGVMLGGLLLGRKGEERQGERHEG